MTDDECGSPPVSVTSAVSATVPWQEGKEEDFAEQREELRKLREDGVTQLAGDSETEEDEEDPGEKHPGERMLWAAQHNKLTLAKELLEHSPRLVAVKDSDLYTPLHRASYNNHLEMARLLLHAGADPLATTEDGWTPLHSAAKWNSAAVVELLLNFTPVNCLTRGGQTPLHLASLSSSSRETLELLLMHPDIDPSIENGQGDTGRDIAGRNSHFAPLYDSVTARGLRKHKE